MKTHNEHPHNHSIPIGGPASGKQTDWRKHKNPQTKLHGSTAFTNNVKTGFWKTYNVRNSGKK